MFKYVLFLMLFIVGMVFGQTEPPEPTVASVVCDPSQDFEIKWGSAGTWASVTPTSVEFLDGVLSNHKYIAGLGEHIWEAVSPDSATQALRKIRFKINVVSVSSGVWWGNFYRVRWRCRVQVDSQVGDPTSWSEMSYWLAVVKFVSPGKPQ